MLLAPPGRGDALASGLATYLRFSRCTLAPAIGGGSGLMVVGPGWREAAAAAGADAAMLAAGGAYRVGEGLASAVWLGHTFLGVPGTIAVTDAAALQGLEVALVAAGAVPASSETLELARIHAGFSAWGAELTDTVLPPEVGIDGSAISYTKGCYVGQETIYIETLYGRKRIRAIFSKAVDPDFL